MTIDIPASWWLTSNQRMHWAEKARRTRVIRNVAGFVALRSGLHPVERATVTVWVGYPSTRRQDPANASPAAKAAIDGIVATRRLLADDDAEHLTAVTFRRDEPTWRKGWYRLRIEFEEVAGNDTGGIRSPRFGQGGAEGSAMLSSDELKRFSKEARDL